MTTGGSSGSINSPIGAKTFPELFGSIIKAVMGIIGSIALVMFVYGGFKMMTAAGNPSKVAEGRNTLVWAAVGLIVAFSSYALVKFVLEAVGAK